MSSFEQKFTEKYGPFKGEKKPTQTIPEKDLIADILDKEFRNVRRYGECKAKKMCEQNGDINKEIENLKRHQNGILEQKGTVMKWIMKLKHLLEGLKGKFEQSEERMSKLGDRKTEITKSVEQTEKRRKMNRV